MTGFGPGRKCMEYEVEGSRTRGRPKRTWKEVVREDCCGDAFPIEGVLVATYLLSVEALPHCRCGVANKNRIV